MATKKAADETAKEVTLTVADTKTDEVKTAKEAPAATTEPVEETKTEPKKRGRKPAAEKEPAKKTGRKTAAEKKAPAKKETVKKPAAKKETTKKTTAKKTEVQETLHIQFAGNDWSAEDLVQRVKDAWKADANQNEKDIKSVDLYVKPEENKVYYVVNGDTQGDMDI